MSSCWNLLNELLLERKGVTISPEDIINLESFIDYDLSYYEECFFRVFSGYLNSDYPFDIGFKNQDGTYYSMIDYVPSIESKEFEYQELYMCLPHWNDTTRGSYILLYISNEGSTAVVKDKFSGKILEVVIGGDESSCSIISSDFYTFLTDISSTRNDLRFREVDKSLLSDLISRGYRQIYNSYTGGDDDFIICDDVNKEFTFSEFGTYPFCDMRKLNKLYKKFDLRYLMKIQR